MTLTYHETNSLYIFEENELNNLPTKGVTQGST